MKDGKLFLVAALWSTIILIIEMVLFYQMGVYVDEYLTSPNIVLGGDFFLGLDWLRLFLVLGLTLFLWIKAFQKN